MFACPNPECKYHTITDAHVHTLVGFGHHGQQVLLQELFGQACHHKFTTRRYALPNRLKTSGARVALGLMPLDSNVTVEVRRDRLMD